MGNDGRDEPAGTDKRGKQVYGSGLEESKNGRC